MLADLIISVGLLKKIKTLTNKSVLKKKKVIKNKTKSLYSFVFNTLEGGIV